MDSIKLDIGCGSHKKPGYIGIDIRAIEGVDIVHDLECFPWPLDDNCCTEIRMAHLWEHIEPRYRIHLMDELWRVAKVDCVLTIISPFANSVDASQDPTHYSCPNEFTFHYFSPIYQLYREYTPLPWRIVKQFVSKSSINVVMVPRKE